MQDYPNQDPYQDAQPQQPPQAAPQPQTVGETQCQAQQPPQAQQAYNPGKAPQGGQPAYMPPEQYAQAMQQVPQSPFSRAWNDIKNTPSAVKEYGIRGLIGCVPILSWCVTGAAGLWASDASSKVQSPLPKDTINGNTFKQGFFFFVLSLVVSLVAGLVNIVPFIGSLAFIAFEIALFYPLVYLMFVRSINFGGLGEGFALGDIFDKLKRNFGQLWCASFLPGLILALISGAIATVLIVIGVMFGSGGAIMSAASGEFSMFDALMLFGSIGVFGLLALIVMLFADVIAVYWGLRGVGYWIADNVPEWNCATAQQVKFQQQQAAWQQQQAAWQQQQAYQQPYAQQAPYQQPQQVYTQTQPQPQPQAQPVQPQPQPQPSVAAPEQASSPEQPGDVSPMQ